MWAPDSRTLYFLSRAGVSAAILSVRGAALVADSTRYLFDLPVGSSDGSVRAVALDPSGKRFLACTPEHEGTELREISVRPYWAQSLGATNREGK
jgi:hypothetical protein